MQLTKTLLGLATLVATTQACLFVHLHKKTSNNYYQGFVLKDGWGACNINKFVGDSAYKTMACWPGYEARIFPDVSGLEWTDKDAGGVAIAVSFSSRQEAHDANGQVTGVTWDVVYDCN